MGLYSLPPGYATDHERTTGNDFAGLHLSSAAHPQTRDNKTDYCVTLMYSS